MRAECRGDSLPRLGDLADGFGDFADDSLDEARVVALGHDADDRLGAGFTDYQAPGLAQPGATFGDDLDDALVVERLALFVADALEQLRHLGEATADLGNRCLHL